MRWLAVFLMMLLPALAGAQDTGAQDKGFIASTLEQSLSGPGRTVSIDGFAGALSSQATMRQMTVADGKGVWLTLRGVTLDWSRAALLSGRVEVNALTADEIVLARLPEPAPTAAPSAEAAGFSLPELPVSVHIGKIAAKRVELGAPVLGQAAELTVSGSLELKGGEGSAALEVRRIDGPQGKFTLSASYANASRQLVLNLSAEEAAHGLLSTLIGLPGAPAIALDVRGAGPIDAYTANIRLATDGQDRLTGAVTLATEAAGTDAAGGGTGPVARTFRADLAGDISPLFAPDYRGFFGPNMRLTVRGRQAGDGTLDLSELRLAAQAVDLSGKVTVGPDGLPRLLDVTGRIGGPGGAPVLLPLPGARTEIGSADLSLQFDAAQGDSWQGSARLSGLARPGFSAGTVTLSGSGHIDPNPTGGAVDGALTVAAEGLAPTDAALAAALGDALQGQLRFAWRKGQPLELPQVALSGAGYGLTGSGKVSGLDAALSVSGQAAARVDDLSRLSGLAGRSLGGAGRVTLAGSAALLAGSFDLRATVEGQDLSAGQPELDSLLKGQSRIAVDARRDESGTLIRSLSVAASTLTASASGVVKTGATDLKAALDFSDLTVLGKGYGGTLSAGLTYREAGGAGHLSLTGAATDLALGQREADRLMRGKTALALEATRAGSRARIDGLTLQNPQLSAKVEGQVAGGVRKLAISARLADLALVAPGFPGPLTVSGTVDEAGSGYAIDLSAAGPGGLKTAVKGSVSADFASADLAAQGGVEAGIVNGLIEPRSVKGPVRFDLRLKGALAPSSLSGTVGLGPARLVAPTLGIAADPLTATVTLGGGRAQVSAQGRLGGGTVTIAGPVTLAAPYSAALAVKLANVLLKNPDLYTTRVSGDLAVSGPLTGGGRIAGALRLGETELRVPSTGLGGSAPIPEMVVVGASAAEQATRVRAGLVKTAAAQAAGGVPFGLDIAISAPNQVFIRGRGLDAELGGRVKLSGTTQNVVPSGGFDLLRGRLDILGKRFDLSQASLRLEGRFVPYVQIAASSSNDGVTSTISIEGEATDPKIAFSSSPPLPQEEVLSQLLFGKGLTKISALQAAQLAGAVATLAGRGGEGIIGKLRTGFGLDNLDLQSSDTGGAQVTAGKYLSKRVYTEVTVGSEGKSSVSLNLDVTKSVTVKGTAGAGGTTGIGIYYQRDY